MHSRLIRSFDHTSFIYIYRPSIHIVYPINLLWNAKQSVHYIFSLSLPANIWEITKRKIKIFVVSNANSTQKQQEIDREGASMREQWTTAEQQQQQNMQRFRCTRDFHIAKFTWFKLITLFATLHLLIYSLFFLFALHISSSMSRIYSNERIDRRLNEKRENKKIKLK